MYSICMYRFVTGCLRIWGVIYKCLSWERYQQRDLGKSSQEIIAKASYQWEAAKLPVLRGEWKDSVCFEKRARMDSFAAVLSTPGYSSKYEAGCDSMIRGNEWRYNIRVCMFVTNSFFIIFKFKKKLCVHWACAFILEFSTVANNYSLLHYSALSYSSSYFFHT
jgi:hypothetical protein